MRKRVHGRIPPAPRESRRCARLARRVGRNPRPAALGTEDGPGGHSPHVPRVRGRGWARGCAGGDRETWSQGVGSKVPCATALPTPDPVGLQAPDREPGWCCKCWGSGWRGCQPPQGTLSLLWHTGWLPVGGGFRGLVGTERCGRLEKWCAGWRGGGHGAGLQRGELSSVPSPGQLHVRARGDAHTGPVPSPGWETMCSQPRGAPGGPPSRNDHDLLLRGVNELCRTTMGTGRLQ